ncbi:uncharacterized protein LY89DRAFT_4584 [Mollisia scopiformis]|uniref:Uncharacterized protein n=1 Tax=Mollisia scopiformis TaxID=149040 RepID=A0A194XUG4_MOLSC|nr:uncharacterized protein LY89DRAFT_4584 [Mollisia scopiformis]KUJ23853.1 hypothetical protein LY89DRAFT_4584 [Mollisia scopiformis]
MEMTPKGYVRPKKGNKRNDSARRPFPLPQDQQAFLEALDFRAFPPRMPTDPSSHLHRPPPRFNEWSPFPNAPYGIMPEEEVLRDRFAHMGFGPGAGAGPAYPPPPPMMDHYPGPEPSHSSKESGFTVSSNDFTDRRVAAKYVSHLIKNGKESWVFKVPDEDDRNGGGSGEPISRPGDHGMKEQKFGAMGFTSKKDEKKR